MTLDFANKCDNISQRAHHLPSGIYDDVISCAHLIFIVLVMRPSTPQKQTNNTESIRDQHQAHVKHHLSS
jgi:hypothetical protein